MTRESRTNLSSPWFQIMLALADGQRHGYGIMQEVEERSSEGFKLWPATLYGAIKRMVAAGLIEPASSAEGDDRRRRYYQLTEMGRVQLAAEARRLDDLIAVARSKHVLPASRGA